MLKIYNPGRDKFDELQGCYNKNFLPFDIEKHKWIMTENIHEADVLAIHGHNLFAPEQLYEKIRMIKELNLKPEQKLLLMHIYHLDSNFDPAYFLMARKILQQEIPNEFAIVHTNLADKSEIPYDFLWNREKIYFTNYNYIDLSNRLYTLGTDIKNFELGPIIKMNDNITNSIKKFLCPNRIYRTFEHQRLEYRKQLAKFLSKYNDQGHYSDPFSGKYLGAENPFVDKVLSEGGGGTWYPIANHYYRGTFFSIYTETVTNYFDDDRPYKSITEKTWDPLIKGHFILPFGYKGMIDHIKSYGFKFPDWIDYSYDVIDDDDLRFEEFLKSAEKLLSYSIQDFHKFFEKDRDILIHNREVFWTHPYDSLYDKVIDFFEIGK